MAEIKLIGDLDEHKKLANLVKSVHANLRQKLRKNGGDIETVWDDHCRNQPLLSDYAESMSSLAQNHWTKNSQTRIDWCHDAIVEYYFEGGMAKAIEKDNKRHHTKCRTKQESGKSFDKSELVSSRTECDAAYSDISCNKSCDFGSCINNMSDNRSSDSTEAETWRQVAKKENYDAFLDGPKILDSHLSPHSITSADELLAHIHVPFAGKVRLLDVGSCYNPFIRYDRFLTVAIDISPASETVLKGDLLKLTVGPAVAAEQEVERRLRGLSSPVLNLPACAFHAVVFSLLLEYLPAPSQRWHCCRQAGRLLQPHGLLLIVTPDSHSQHRNAGMVRSWRTALETLGLGRWRYVKLPHLHCMAFRKVPARRPLLPTPASPQTAAEREARTDHERSEPLVGGTGGGSGVEEGGLGEGRHLGDVVELERMMFIPQDFSARPGKEEGEEDEEEEAPRFGSEEERRLFFSDVSEELPGWDLA